MPVDDAATTPLSAPALPSQPYRTAALASRKPTRFAFTPDAAARRQIALALDLIELPRCSFKGEFQPQGRHDYLLNASLHAIVMQPCAISLAPVTTEIRETVTRCYSQEYVEPTGDETELQDDLDAEPLPEVVDIAAVAIEALLLALPLFPRAPGAVLGEISIAAPGVQPLDDAALMPFAGLAGLAARLKTPDPGTD